MNQNALTAKYRPQTFAETAGQDLIKKMLSRAAAEDKIAPAYLFSGTRGVGKTTLARILAKAVNCEAGPGPEPCNKCRHCRQITQGASMDVIEMDGASNRGVDDARRIKEGIGYAAMDSRYKVFIIDEAHMLTKEAFNALLKTLEEPPRNVTFILATTEPHKFPVTIVSRCQHYVFKRLSPAEIEAHLKRVLEMEGVGFEPAALKLIARRGAGSVRDSMSLLGQVMALGGERVEADGVRSVLGLAGSEFFARIMDSIRDQDPAELVRLLGVMLDQGLDLGFFIRELTQIWRNLFLLKQVGEKGLPLLELSEEEAAESLEWAGSFGLSHIHAAWQLTLEGQRRVLTSLEPALALELLLLNLAYLPDLLTIEQFSAGRGPGQARVPARRPVRPAPGGAPPGPGRTAGPERAGAPPQAVPRRPGRYSPPPSGPGPELGPEPDDFEDQGGPGAEAPMSDSLSGPKNWAGFCAFLRQAAEKDGKDATHLLRAKGEFSNGELVIDCINGFHYEQLDKPDFKIWLGGRVADYFGPDAVLTINRAQKAGPAGPGLKEGLEQRPVVKLLMRELNAKYMESGRLDEMD